MKSIGKKSEAGLTAIIIVIIVALFLGWLFNISQRECRSNKDCGSEAFCGSDFSCHTYPTIQKTIVNYNLVWPSLILGFAIVIAVIILKWNDIMPRKPEESKPVEEYKSYEETITAEPKEISEEYYKSNSEIK